MISSKKQEQISSMLLLNTITVGDGSIFSLHISRIPLQSICRMGARFQEGTHNQKGHIMKYIISKNASSEETVRAAELFQKENEYDPKSQS
jgi:hypothetical protein